jgi:hypothetical protein
VLEGLIPFDARFGPYIDMERFIPRFPRLLFCRLIHQSNQKISAQSILLSLNHTHPIQLLMPVEMVIKFP